jgi:hypothetical protein
MSDYANKVNRKSVKLNIQHPTLNIEHLIHQLSSFVQNWVNNDVGAASCREKPAGIPSFSWLEATPTSKSAIV